MTTTVKLVGLHPTQVMNIIYELRDMGYVQGTDFDFKYVPTITDDHSVYEVFEKCTFFTFYKDSLASWFTLKYG